MADQRRPRPSAALFVALMGLASLYNVAMRPRFAAFAAVDVFGLIVAGMCFGAAIVTMVTFLRSRGSDRGSG